MAGRARQAPAAKRRPPCAAAPQAAAAPQVCRGIGRILGHARSAACAWPPCRSHAAQTAGGERRILHIITAAFRPGVQCRSGRRRVLRRLSDRRRLPASSKANARVRHARSSMRVRRGGGALLRRDPKQLPARVAIRDTRAIRTAEPHRCDRRRDSASTPMRSRITDRVRVHRSRRVAPSSRSGPRRRTQRSFLDTNMTAAHSRAARRHR